MNGGAAIQLGRVRARMAGGATSSNTVAQLRAAHLLGTADLFPAGIPPSATLFIRKLSDPLPGRVDLGEPSPTAAAEWQRATRAALAGFFSRAARPSREHVPADAVAVRFDDEGELVACFALDLARGRAAECWWWRQGLRELPVAPAGALMTLLCRRATLVPAALHHLDAWGEAETVISTLNTDQAKSVFVAVSQVHDLPAVIREPAAAAVSEGPLTRSA